MTCSNHKNHVKKFQFSLDKTFYNIMLNTKRKIKLCKNLQLIKEPKHQIKELKNIEKFNDNNDGGI